MHTNILVGKEEQTVSETYAYTEGQY